MTKPKSKAAGTLCFVDADGGAFAALAAGIARAQGHEGALAATTAKKVALPVEIGSVLTEIGATLPEVTLATAAATRRIDVSAWGTPLHVGDESLERLAVARIARDRIERHLESEKL
jgi:hypothetical protein